MKNKKPAVKCIPCETSSILCPRHELPKPAAPKSSPLPFKIMRVVEDEPEEGESGTIYRYNVMDSYGKEVVWTWDKDYAELIVRRVNQGPAFDAMFRALENQMKIVDELGLDGHDEARAAIKLARAVR
jgi:hypothetical protein